MVLPRYPIILMAPDAFETSSERPIGTGPFKFVSWTHWNETRLVRFENYWESDAEGHQLPYLDEIVAKPKREDSVRLTALRTGQVQLIDDMAQADVARFTQEHSAKYNTWRWHSGGNYIVFNWRRGVFQDKRLRTAAAVIISRLFAMQLGTIAAVKRRTLKAYVEALHFTGASHTYLACC